MPKKVDKQQLKEDLRAYIQEWFQTDPLNKYQLGNYYRVESEQTKTVKLLSRDTIKHMLVSKANACCEDGVFADLGNGGKLWPTEVHMIMLQIDSEFDTSGNQENILAIGDTPLDGNYSNRQYAINRLPIDFGLPQTVPAKDWPVMLDALMDRLPEFYHDLRSRMV